MSLEESSGDEDLEEVLTRAQHSLAQIREKIESIERTIGNLPEEHRERIPEFNDRLSRENLEDYLDEVQTIVQEPQISRSEELLSDLGLSESALDRLDREVKSSPAEIEEIVKTYQELHDEFGAVVEFIIDDGILISWIEEHGLSSTLARLRIENIGKYEQITTLNIAPLEFKKDLFKSIYLNERDADVLQDLPHWFSEIEEAGIDPAYSGEFNSYLESVEATAKYSNKLEEEFGYDSDQITEIVGDHELETAREELREKITKLEQEKENVERRVQEYCEILDQEPPETEDLETLRIVKSRLHSELESEIGETGEQIWEYLLHDGEAPKDVDKEDLLRGLANIRPLLRERME